MMYKSQFQKIDPYDWFCGPQSQVVKSIGHTLLDVKKWSWSAFLNYLIMFPSEVRL